MFKSLGTLVYFYAKKHWDSGLPKELRFKRRDAILAAKCFVDRAKTTQNGSFIRLIGQSGVGKTTQLMPAAEAFFKKKKVNFTVVAARELAILHPFYDEILKKYGSEEIRRRTDDFATMVMFYVLADLTERKADFILDLSFVGRKVERIFLRMTQKYSERLFLMMAVPEWKNRELLSEREWRHDKKLEAEFLKSTKLGLKYYGEKIKDGRLIMWGFNDLEPVYDGNFKESSKAFEKEMRRKRFEKNVEIEKLIRSKRKYLENMV